MQKVVFRMVKNEVLAILPGIPANFGNVVYYAHIGQHGECDSRMTSAGRLATPAEYKALHAELIGQGYDDLKICKKVQHADLRASWSKDGR